MKNVYINSRLHELLIPADRVGAEERPEQWIFSLGEAWLLLTPEILAILARRLGREDARVNRLIRAVRRHSPRVDDFCRRLGLEPVGVWRPEDYPLGECPSCGGLRQAHPEETGAVCLPCERKAERNSRLGMPGGRKADWEANLAARRRILGKSDIAFDPGVVNPYAGKRISRCGDLDWDKARQLRGRGLPYAAVAKAIGCSLGLAYKRLKPAAWFNN